MRTFTRNILPGLIMALVGLITSAIAAPNAVESPTPTNKAEQSGEGPKAQYAVPIYDFGRVQAGELVKYTFVLTNVGDQTLEISHVQPSCGCTAAGDWTRKVEPGQTGDIPIQFNSANFNGQVFKTISVTSNDKQKPVMVLQLKGTVWKPLELIPPYTVINVPPDALTASASVRILNHTEDALTVTSPECNTPTFKVDLITNTPGKEYTLALSSVGELGNGNIQGKVKVKTSSAKTPTLEIPFWVNVQPALTVIPRSISLPQTPLKADAPTSITIQNNSTNVLTLKDVAMNIPGVDVQLKEVQPGKLFNAVVTFPVGFEPPPGKAVELSMKSNLPRMAEIKVPVIPAPRPLMPHPAPPMPQKPTASNSATPGPVAPAIR